MGERVRARATVEVPRAGALYARGARILDGQYAGSVFALEGFAAFGDVVSVEFCPDDQFAYIVR